jgi:RNA exonuclease 4
VNTSGTIVYHSHVSPPRNTIVTDYRTHISGITKEILAEKGRSFLKVQQEVARRINGAILVGHALENDLKALGLQYPRAMIRNTAHLPQFQTLDKRGHLNPQKLKNLAARYLDVTIQEGEHDPAEDARAAMALYTKYGDLWEENSRPIGPTVIGKNKTRRRVRSRKE